MAETGLIEPEGTHSRRPWACLCEKNFEFCKKGNVLNKTVAMFSLWKCRVKYNGNKNNLSTHLHRCHDISNSDKPRKLLFYCIHLGLVLVYRIKVMYQKYCFELFIQKHDLSFIIEVIFIVLVKKKLSLHRYHKRIKTQTRTVSRLSFIFSYFSLNLPRFAFSCACIKI